MWRRQRGRSGGEGQAATAAAAGGGPHLLHHHAGRPEEAVQRPDLEPAVGAADIGHQHVYLGRDRHRCSTAGRCCSPRPAGLQAGGDQAGCAAEAVCGRWGCWAAGEHAVPAGGAAWGEAHCSQGVSGHVKRDRQLQIAPRLPASAAAWRAAVVPAVLGAKKWPACVLRPVMWTYCRFNIGIKLFGVPRMVRVRPPCHRLPPGAGEASRSAPPMDWHARCGEERWMGWADPLIHSSASHRSFPDHQCITHPIA